MWLFNCCINGFLIFTRLQIINIVQATNIPSQVIELNDKFLQVKNDGLWFVDFYAPWCAHCKRLTPVWEQVGHALADRQSLVRVAKLDCTRYTNTASALNIRGYPTIIFFRNGREMVYEGERKKEAIIDFAIKAAGPMVGIIERRSLSDWIHSERWSLIPLITSTNVKEVGRMRLLVLTVFPKSFVFVDSPRLVLIYIFRFFSLVTNVAQMVRKDSYLSNIFQFGWLDGNELANNVILVAVLFCLGLLVFNVTSYEYYSSNDAVSVMTEKSIISFLERIATGDVAPLGGRSLSQRFKRLCFEVFTNIAEMFRAQPLLTLCLLGVPLSFLSLITYCICSTDFSIDRDEIYPDDDDSFISGNYKTVT
uniref:Bm7602, isoform a n=1 Tax=Brugia malayi TaxID=6279 RepID=A0A1I9G662_BRUMA|nr:Bm7602, isoform a [Brugia malayi]